MYDEKRVNNSYHFRWSLIAIKKEIEVILLMSCNLKLNQFSCLHLFNYPSNVIQKEQII